MKRHIIIASAAIVGIAGATTFALSQQPSSAEEIPPIVQQVNDHEVRIDSLEDRATTTEQTVAEQGQQLQAVQESVGVTAPRTAPQTGSQGTAGQPSHAASEPTPAPAPEPHPRTILAVRDEPQLHDLHACTYTFHSAYETMHDPVRIQPVSIPCWALGSIAPEV